MHHLEGRKVRWAGTPAERRGEEEEAKGTESELMVRVGRCGSLTALRGPPSPINTVPDINNNT